MPTEKFTLEREGQEDFYNRFLPRVNSNLTLEDILQDNNDGVLNGNLLEFKLHVTDLNAHLFQCIKYLSARRIKGKPIPANILIIDVNASKLWLYKSKTYLKFIERVYSGGASKDNTGFIGKDPESTFQYNKQKDAEKVVSLLKENNFTKIHIDENCIVGWATAFYKRVPGSRKEDFIGDDTGKHKTIGEIRKPVHFKEYIYPYVGQSNVKFNYLMDRLNDTIQKKNLGAFYTHPLYAAKALELVRKAIERVPKGNDYIILDRCAGTGNLEAGLTDEELSHCIVSTVEYYEYKVLQELFGAKVRHIIPPIECDDTFIVATGNVKGADALSEEYVINPIIKQYVDNPKCTIILYENPPYTETTSIEHQKVKAGQSSNWKTSYIMSEITKDPLIKDKAKNDVGNLFIWSGFKYYLRQPTDSYVMFSPAKYWKAQKLFNKRFIQGFAFNRSYFHAKTTGCILCTLWTPENSNIDMFQVTAYNITKTNELLDEGILDIKRVYYKYSSKFYDKREFPNDIKNGIFAEFNGSESHRITKRIKPVTNDNILGYLVVKGFNFDNPDSCVHLLRVGAYDANGFYLRSDNYLEKLPMFCASRYITYNHKWTERARIMKSADGYELFNKDVKSKKLNQFLLKCLLFTCLERQNHIISFIGSDSNFYRNELCLDNTIGDTQALKDIKRLKFNKLEKKLLQQWDTVLRWAKEAANYNSKLTYGVYQIANELDISHTDEITGHTVWDNIELHTALTGLKELVKDYYNTEIVPVLFQYDFLK